MAHNPVAVQAHFRRQRVPHELPLPSHWASGARIVALVIEGIGTISPDNRTSFMVGLGAFQVSRHRGDFDCHVSGVPCIQVAIQDVAEFFTKAPSTDLRHGVFLRI